MPDVQDNRQSDAPRGDDAFANLYRMSTTAGVGTQEYVAINLTAVAAVLFGFASSLALLTGVLLILPIAGLILGVVALYQIAHSSGTQTGRWLAWAGILLSLGFLVFVGTRAVTERVYHREDQQQIVALIERLGTDIKAGEFQQAYDLFSPAFQQRVPFEQFRGIMQSAQRNETFGALEQIRWNGVPFAYEQGATTDLRFARGIMMLEFDKSEEPLRQDVGLRRSGSAGWKIDNVPQLFPEQRPQQQ